VIVRTFDGLQALTTPASSALSASSTHALHLYGLNQAYGEIYQTQPNVRICVDFLSRNVAQLGLPVYRKVSQTDRARLNDHDLAAWLSNPNPDTCRYRLIESLVADLGVYFNAYWLKVRYERDGRPAIGLVRLPPEEMEAKGGLLRTHFEWTVDGRVKRFERSEIVYFNGYNPLNPRMGLSPLETLRRILAEEAAAGDHRESFWRNSARIDGTITRPKEVKRYTKEQAADWREQFQTVYAGGAGSGKTLLLQEGETFVPGSWSAKDSEYTVGGKLRREICAAQWHIPQPMVGILEHATFSNIREQHKHLYQDCLGPLDEMITQEIERQLLIECADRRSVYIEFNIDAKLAGTPEERAESLHQAIGRPWVTVNEGRALENRPRIDDPELDTVAPQQGGPSDATVHPARRPPAADPARPDDNEDDDDDADARAIAPAVLHAARLRQQAHLGKLPVIDRASAFFGDLERWNRELTADLTPLLGAERAARRAQRANAATLTALIAGEEAA
jgi:HK97 family phage portal protein